MNYSKKELADYRILRAKEALQEAKLLGASQHWNTAGTRLYYACFYIASAYMVKNDITASTHNGVKIAFNSDLIHTGKIKREYGQLYNKLLKLRQDADYRDFRDVSEDSIKPLFLSVKELISEVEALLDTKS